MCLPVRSHCCRPCPSCATEMSDLCRGSGTRGVRKPSNLCFPMTPAGTAGRPQRCAGMRRAHAPRPLPYAAAVVAAAEEPLGCRAQCVAGCQRRGARRHAPRPHDPVHGHRHGAGADPHVPDQQRRECSARRFAGSVTASVRLPRWHMRPYLCLRAGCCKSHGFNNLRQEPVRSVHSASHCVMWE